MQVVKRVVGIGNGAAVYVPKEYLNKEVVVVFPLEIEGIKKEIIDKVSMFMDEIIGIYLVGSYAREEQGATSDIDVLVITKSLNKRVKGGKYEMAFVSIDVIERQLKENAIPIVPMLKEAKTVMNSWLIEKFKNVKLNKKNLKFHIETTKSALKVIKNAVEIAKLKKEKVSDNVAYSLILRMREAYIVDCLIKNRKWSKKEFLELVRKIAGSVGAYESYERIKNEEKEQKNLKLEEAEKIYNYIKKEIEKQEKWAGKRG